MSQLEDPKDGAERPEQPAERGELEGSETVSLLGTDVEAPINAAVQISDSEDSDES